MAGGDELGDRYVVANGAEGEPGTFKDRALIRGESVPGGRRTLRCRAHRRRTRSVPRRQGELCPRDRGPRARTARDGRCRADRRDAGDARERARGISLRRGEGAARSDRGQRADAALAAALSPRSLRDHPAGGMVGRGRSVRRSRRHRIEPDAGLERRDAGERRVDTRPRRGLVPQHRHRGDARPADLHRRRRRGTRWCRGDRARHRARRGHRPDRWWTSTRPSGQSGAFGRLEPGADRGRARARR